jgi:hypothetical protein
MSAFVKKLKSIFSGNNHNTIKDPSLDIDGLVNQIKSTEEVSKPEPGRKIYSFMYYDFELILDVEVTGQYRLSAFSGKEKKYGFLIKCETGNYEVLAEGLKQCIDFLNGNRKIGDLPDNEVLKGHYFG